MSGIQAANFRGYHLSFSQPGHPKPSGQHHGYPLMNNRILSGALLLLIALLPVAALAKLNPSYYLILG